MKRESTTIVNRSCLNPFNRRREEDEVRVRKIAEEGFRVKEAELLRQIDEERSKREEEEQKRCKIIKIVVIIIFQTRRRKETCFNHRRTQKVFSQVFAM